MANANTIREFLIGLGVDIDQNAVRRFTSTIDSLTKEVERFVFKLTAMTTLLEAAVVKTASALENLYFIAQRAGTTVDNLRALQYGMANVGLSADTANQALESLATSLRINPGNESLLNYLGVRTRDLKGNMRDTSEVMGDFISRLSKMPPYIAAQYAQMFGINAQTLNMLIKNYGEIQEQTQKWKDLAATLGVNLDDITKRSHIFMESFRETGEIVELIWTKLADTLMTKFGPQLNQFNQWLLDHSKDIQDFAMKVVTAVTGMATALTGAIPTISALVQATIGWKDALTVIGDILVYRIFGPLGLILALYNQLKGIADSNLQKRFDEDKKRAESGQKPLLGPGSEYSPSDWLEKFKYLGTVIGNGIKDILKQPAPIQQESYEGSGIDPNYIHKAAFDTGGFDTGGPTDQNGRPNAQINPTAFNLGNEAQLPPSGRPPISVRQNNPGNLRFGQGEIGESGGFAVFNSALEGFQALRRQLQIYASRGLNSVQDIISKYAPSSENNTGAYINNLSRSMGVGANQALNLQDPNTLSALMAGITRIESGYNPWSRDLINQAAGNQLGSGISSGRMGGNVTIHQKTDIHVHGQDAHTTAQETTRQQDTVNATLVRNFRSAVLA